MSKKRIRLTDGNGNVLYAPMQPMPLKMGTGPWWNEDKQPESEQSRRFKAECAPHFALEAAKNLAKAGELEQLDPITRRPTRRIDDPPDARHSPELVEDQPEYTLADLYGDLYGLDENGQAKLPEQITPEQAAARAAKYRGVA